jgi:hypothetical protein
MKTAARRKENGLVPSQSSPAIQREFNFPRVELEDWLKDRLAHALQESKVPTIRRERHTFRSDGPRFEHTPKSATVKKRRVPAQSTTLNAASIAQERPRPAKRSKNRPQVSHSRALIPQPIIINQKPTLAPLEWIQRRRRLLLAGCGLLSAGSVAVGAALVFIVLAPSTSAISSHPSPSRAQVQQAGDEATAISRIGSRSSPMSDKAVHPVNYDELRRTLQQFMQWRQQIEARSSIK